MWREHWQHDVCCACNQEPDVYGVTPPPPPKRTGCSRRRKMLGVVPRADIQAPRVAERLVNRRWHCVFWNW
jgi:hypothetical protein